METDKSILLADGASFTASLQSYAPGIIFILVLASAFSWSKSWKLGLGVAIGSAALSVFLIAPTAYPTLGRWFLSVIGVNV